MQKIIWMMLLALTTVWACPMGACAQKGSGPKACHGKMKKGHFLKGITTALESMGKAEDADVKMAVYSYQMAMKTTPRGLPLDAFKDDGFDKTYYLEHARQTLKAQAQAELIDTIYTALNAEEKKRFTKEVRAYQENRFQNKQGGKSCPSKGSCHAKAKAGCACDVKCACEGQKVCQCDEGCSCKKCKAMKKRP